MKTITFEKSDPIKILLFRTDRIGDVVLTLPCIEALKATYPKSHICFALQSYTAPLVENNPFLDEIILTDTYTQKELVQIIKAKKFDISISFFASKIACYVPFLAKIPIRIGPFSKLRALLFTHKVTQKRSLGEKNEAQYNLDLLKILDCKSTYFPKIYLNDEEKKSAQNYISDKYSNQKLPLIILHPGSGGSSRDWKIENYFLLAQKIIENNLGKILITGSQNELDMYQKILPNYPLLTQNNLLEKQEPLRRLLSIISCGSIFVSNSTGPLHCASALGIKTIGFYPLLQTCSPQRWGVFSNEPNKHITLVPNKENYDAQKCANKPFEECMELISLNEAFEAINTLIETSSV